MLQWHVLDLETTGLNPEEHEIAELALLTCEGNSVVSVYHKFFSITSISEKAAQTNGLSVEKLKGWPPFTSPEIINELKNLIKYKIFAHNVQFDARFLARHGVIGGFHPVRDTLTYCKADSVKLENNKLQTWLNHYGLATEAHNALDDAFNLFKLITLKGWQIK